MALPAPLSRNLRDRLGTDTAEALVTWLEEMRAEHATNMARIDAMEGRILERMHSLEIRLVDRLNAADAKHTQQLSDVRADLMKWSFVFWCGAVAAIAALAGVLRTP